MSHPSLQQEPQRVASIRIQRRVDWSDTDASGHYHYTTAFRFADAAEAVLYDRLGIAHATFGRTPRIRATGTFRKPLHFHDLVDISFWVHEIKRTSITCRFEVHRDGELMLDGEVVSVLLTKPEGELLPWPDDWREQLLTAGPQPPERLS